MPVAAVTHPGPLLGHRYTVTVGAPSLGRRGQAALAFHRVDLPLLHVQPSPEAPPPLLVLHRAADADTRLHDWWAAAAAGTATARTVSVHVLDAHGRPSGLGWQFSACRPVHLACSSLDARQPEVVVEQLALSFQRCERLQRTPRRPGHQRA